MQRGSECASLDITPESRDKSGAEHQAAASDDQTRPVQTKCRIRSGTQGKAPSSCLGRPGDPQVGTQTPGGQFASNGAEAHLNPYTRRTSLSTYRACSTEVNMPPLALQAFRLWLSSLVSAVRTLPACRLTASLNSMRKLPTGCIDPDNAKDHISHVKTMTNGTISS